MSGNHAFEVPMYPIVDIVAALKDFPMKISVTENDFLRPDPRRWLEVYGSIYHNMTSRSIEDAVQVFGHYGNMKLDYKELYEEGMSQVGFALCMQRLLCSCGFSNFSLHDIIAPTRKRLIKVMSLLINKMKHDRLRSETFEAIRDRCEQSKEERDRMLNLNNELKQQWERKMENEERREKLKLECTEESEKLNSQITDNKRQCQVEQGKLEELKRNFAEKAALKEELKTEKSNFQQEHDKLSQKIVHSPDRFKQDQERLKKKIVELKELNDVKLNKLTTEKAITKQTANNRTASEKAVRLAKEVLTDLEKANELLSEMDQCNDNLRQLQDDVTALYTTCDDVNENIAIRQSQKHTLTHQLNLKKKGTLQQKEDVKRHHDIYQEKLDGIKLQEKQIRNEILELKQKCLTEDNHCEKMAKEWDMERAGIYQELDILHNHIANRCKQFKEIF